MIFIKIKFCLKNHFYVSKNESNIISWSGYNVTLFKLPKVHLMFYEIREDNYLVHDVTSF